MKTDLPAPEPLIRRFMPELDVLRGIAVLGVLLFHGFRVEFGDLPFTGARKVFLLATQAGVLGVNLFFVLSGFLITGILLDSRNRPDYYRRFYKRRALRILPAYYSLLIALALLHQASAAFLGLSFVYLSNVAGLFGVFMDYHPLWSLAVEEHYYIAWPSVVRNLGPRFLAMFSFALCILIPVARAVSFHYGHFQGSEWYTWFNADGLAEGSLLAIMLRSSIRSSVGTSVDSSAGSSIKGLVGRKYAAIAAVSLLMIAMLGLIAGVPFGILSRQTALGASVQLTLVNTFFAGLLLLFLVVGSGSRRTLINSSILGFFGYISYGLYLVHLMIFRIYDKFTAAFWPSLQPSAAHFDLIVLRFAIVAAVSTGVAFVSRKYYEEWFLQLKERGAVRPEQAAKQSPDEPHVRVVVSAPASIAATEVSESF